MNTRIEAVKCDITKAENVEVIVNATNPSLKGSKGVTGAIHKAAGPLLRKECKALKGCSVGDAVITSAYNLPYKAIIHAVGPEWKDGKHGEALLLKNCYLRSLEIAYEHGFRSIAFPSISTGTFKYPLNEAAEIAVKTVVQFCDDHPDAFDYICWTLLVEPTRKTYEDEITKYDIVFDYPDEWNKNVIKAEYQLYVSDAKQLTGPIEAEVKEKSFQYFEYDEIIEIDFAEEVPKADQWDYAAAAASGLLSGALSLIWGKGLDLESAHEWGAEKLGKVVIKVAKTQGFSKNDLDGAIRFLEKKFPIASDTIMSEMGGALQHHLRDFTHHPTIAGLLFSIVSQFTGKGFGTDTQGHFQTVPLPEHALVGKTFEEKIVFGTINWVFHLISDMDGSSLSPGAGTGIPGPLLSFIKELSALPIFKNVKLNYKESEISFSQWISKLFNGTYYRNEEGKPIRFDLRTEIGLTGQLFDQTKPVIINEGVVRSMYFFRRLSWEINDNKIKKITDLKKLDPQRFLPFKTRALTRMLTVSSGVFVLVNSSGTAIKASVKGKGDTSATAIQFFLNLNYVGIARFGISCVADAKYITEDVQEAYEKYQEYQWKKQAEKNAQLFTEYKFLSLNEERMKILYSLEDQMIRYDISHTKNKKQIENKKLWLNNWESLISNSLHAKPEEVLIRDEDQIYSQLRQEWWKTDEKGWLTVLATEYSLFESYIPLGSLDDKKYKGLKLSSDYRGEVFCSKQSIISKKELTSLKKSVIKYESLLSGKTQKALIGVAGTAAMTVATGGLAFAFAPEIAIYFAGGAVAGLHGAALANASLAFVGGGALAAGGLGMAGGTAILTGGGALLGVAGSGTVSMLTILSNVSEEYILSECAKLLTVCKTMIENDSSWTVYIRLIKSRMEHICDDTKHDIELAQMQTKDKDRNLIKKMKTGYKYMEKTKNELLKIVNQ